MFPPLGHVSLPKEKHSCLLQMGSLGWELRQAGGQSLPKYTHIKDMGVPNGPQTRLGAAILPPGRFHPLKPQDPSATWQYESSKAVPLAIFRFARRVLYQDR